MPSARATGYVPLRVEHRSVHEGNLAELTLVLRKTAPPPTVGPAPPFSVTLTDGRSLSLGDLRGKFVLVHFWFPVDRPGAWTSIGPVRAVHDRFGKDDRLVMLGLCLAHSPRRVRG